jgi:hypothetical protein
LENERNGRNVADREQIKHQQVYILKGKKPPRRKQIRFCFPKNEKEQLNLVYIHWEEKR